MKRLIRTGRPARPRTPQGSKDDRLIGERVRALLDKRNLDSAGIARQLDLKAEQLLRLLKGESLWSISLVSRLAKLLEVPATDLDPGFDPTLLVELSHLELRTDVPHLQALYALVRSLPQIQEPGDLEALIRILRNFSIANRVNQATS